MNSIKDLLPGSMRERTFQLKARRDAGAVWNDPQFVECKKCGRRATRQIWNKAQYVCPNCGVHLPIGGYYRLSLILDKGSFRELDADLAPQDVLQFPGYPEKLEAQTGKTGQALTENEWLMSIRSRVGIPGGTCSFDLPAYHAWQNLDPRYRQRDLEDWASELTPLGQALELILQLLRETGIPQRVVAEQGVFQQAMPVGRSFQLLRLRIDPHLNLVPEISGNRLLVSVRLLRLTNGSKPQPSNDDASFELTLCA